MTRKIPIFLRVILDFVCLLTVGLPILILYLVGKPYERGFNCDDESIRYPFKDSTITNTTLYLFGILGSSLVIIITESIRYFTNSDSDTKQYQFLRWKVPPLIWQVYRKLGCFAFGACLSQLTTDIAKYTIGRLRPHFIEVCAPDTDCRLASNLNTYITKFRCTKEVENEHLIREARLSFMSGHSSFSAFTMLYLALYLQSRMTYRQIKLLRPFLQAICLWVAWGTALSRISDYKHHWSDVMAGSIQGVIVALIVVFYISDLFPKKTPKMPAILSQKTEPDYNSCALDQRS